MLYNFVVSVHVPERDQERCDASRLVCYILGVLDSIIYFTLTSRYGLIIPSRKSGNKPIKKLAVFGNDSSDDEVCFLTLKQLFCN